MGWDGVWAAGCPSEGFFVSKKVWSKWEEGSLMSVMEELATVKLPGSVLLWKGAKMTRMEGQLQTQLEVVAVPFHHQAALASYSPPCGNVLVSFESGG